MASVKNWFNSLIGKPPERANVVPGEPQNVQQKVTPEPEQTTSPRLTDDLYDSSEDSVLKDLSNLKKFVGKKLGKASSSVGIKSKELTQKVRSSNKAAKFVKFVGVLFVLLIIALIASAVIKKTGIGMRNDEESNNQGEKPSPTPINFQPGRPSIYADDPEVLRIEEAIDALEKEISRAQLRESGLIPPVLDYNINFKQ